MSGLYTIVHDGDWWLVKRGIAIVGRYVTKADAQAAIESGAF